MIFIVDDDQATRDSLSLLLASEGLHSKGFGSPRAFLDACRPSGEDRLIVDVDLPGMDGIEFLQRLRARGLMLPVIIITGLPSTFVRQQALATGATAFLEKPLDAGEIISLVREGEAPAP
jgi:two-component system response regulator FixJ